MTPKISIVTITLNSARYLEQTITSVTNQSYKNIEYIIIDGGSTDSTLDIIERYDSKINHWTSEPDEGIADAMNKGLAIATGDYILFLHSDDYLLNNLVLEHASNSFLKVYDLYIFQVILDGKNGHKVANNRSLGWMTNFKMGCCHQGQFCSKKLYDKIGGFNTEFEIDMDYDFLLRAYRTGCSSLAINLPISVMRLIGISSKTDLPSLMKRFAEERAIHERHCPNLWMAILYQLYWPPYLAYRKARSLFNSLLNWK